MPPLSRPILPTALGSLRAMLAGSAWFVVAGLLSQGSMLLSNVLVANLLGASDYGRYALLQSTIQVLAGLAQISLTVVIAQQVASSRIRNPAFVGEITSFGFILVVSLSTLFAGGLFVGRSDLASGLFKDGAIAPGLAVSAFALPWVAATAVQQGFFSGLERFRTQTAIAVALVPVVIVAPALGAWRYSLMGALAGVTLVYVVRFIVPQFIVGRIFREMRLRWSPGSIRSKLGLLLRYALPATVSGILNSLAIWGGQTILIRSDGGAQTVGYFAAAYMVKTIVIFAPAQMAIALLPSLSRKYAEGDLSGSRRLLLTGLVAGFVMTLMLGGVTLLFAPEILSVFGKDFAASRSVLLYLILATPFEAIALSFTMRFQATTQFWRAMLATNLPLAVTLIGLAAFLVPQRHADGLALAWLAAWILTSLTTVLATVLIKPRSIG